MGKLAGKIFWIVAVSFRLGHSTRDKLRLFWGGIWLFLRDKSKSTMNIDVHLRHQDFIFPFRIVDFGDYGTLYEVFCDEIYAVDLDGPVKNIIDIGSNIGASAVYFANHFPDASVQCYEPDSSAFASLSVNAENFEQVIVHADAIWSETTTRIFYSDPHRTNSSSFEQRRSRQQAVTVRTSTLNDVMSSLGVELVDIIKFDVEGAEIDIFQSFEHFDKVRLLIGEIHSDLIGGADHFLDLIPDFFRVNTTTLGPDRINLIAVNTGLIPQEYRAPDFQVAADQAE